MPISSSDIKIRLSGGASNSDVNASLGGAKSSTELTNSSTHNLFDLISSAEASAGDTEYRCVYIHNGHGSLTAKNCVVFISSNTPSASTTINIGLGSASVGSTEQTVADESTAPTSVSFSTAAGSGNSLSIGDIAAGSHKAIWIKRIVSAGMSATTGDAATIQINFDTAA